jgi:polyisoprenoid-binding protein YceI
MTRPLVAAVLVAVLAGPAAAQSAQTPPATAAKAAWRIDTNHSELSFRIRHFVSKVRGTFGEWSGTILATPGAWADGSVEVTVRVASITTQNERRDNRLDYGLQWNRMVEGSAMLGDEVEVAIVVAAVRQPPG